MSSSTVSWKTEIFLRCAKKRQKECRKKDYFSIEFYHFYIGHTKSCIFSNPLNGH
jgi:hypothetical protein